MYASTGMVVGSESSSTGAGSGTVFSVSAFMSVIYIPFIAG
jgi:hypothetical protein